MSVRIILKAIQDESADKPLLDAAKIIRARHPSECLEVLEIIGSWPSSEPELLALQET